jgi:hypothetical protein
VIRRAIILVVVFAILHVAGAREAVGFLSGTVPEGHGVPLFGALYLLAWFGAVLVAPILLIAAAIEKVYVSVRRTASRTSSTE